MTLSSLIPDPEKLLALTPEELGHPLLKVIGSLPEGQQHLHNYLLSQATSGYPPKYHDRIREAVSEAWQWLLSKTYIATRPGDPTGQFMRITRPGLEYLAKPGDDRSASTAAPDSAESPRNLSSGESSTLAKLAPWARCALASRCAARLMPVFVPGKAQSTEEARRDVVALEMCWKLVGLAAQGRLQPEAVVVAAVRSAEMARDAALAEKLHDPGFDAAEVAGWAAGGAMSPDGVSPLRLGQIVISHELAFARVAGAMGLGAGISGDAKRSLDWDLDMLVSSREQPAESTRKRLFQRPLWFGSNPERTLQPWIEPWRARLLELRLGNLYDDHLRLIRGTINIDWDRTENEVRSWSLQIRAEAPAQPTEAVSYVRVTADLAASTPAAQPRPSLKMLADIPLDNDAGDQLGFRPYADALAGLIDSPHTMTPLTLTINAPWGAGKTTLANMIRQRLEGKPAAEGYSPHVTCWFDAWKHDDSPNLASSLAAQIARAAQRSRTFWRRILKPLPRSLDPAGSPRMQGFLLTLNVILLVLVVSELVSPTVGCAVLDAIRLDPKAISAVHAAVSAGLVGAFYVLYQLLAAVLPTVKSVAEFVKDPGSAARTASMDEVGNQLGQLVKEATPEASKFVIFIDDLDRCRPPGVLGVLEAVNQLLNQQGIVTVIMGDMPAVAACAELRYRRLSISPEAKRSQGRAYLQKIVQLQFDLPAYSAANIRAFIQQLAAQAPPGPVATGPLAPTLVRRLSEWFQNHWRRKTKIKRVRTEIDKSIEARLAGGDKDFAAMEEVVASSVKNSRGRIAVKDLVRERVQHRLGHESEVMSEAQEEATDYVQLFPRHAKRLLNRLRLLLFIAHERKMFGGRPALTARHIGKWAVLCERWPKLAQALLAKPEAMKELEGRAEGKRPELDRYDQVVEVLAPDYVHDSQLRDFLRSGTELAPLIDRIVRFEPAASAQSAVG